MATSFSGFPKPLKDARYVVLGVPYDHTSTYRSGSRFAPRAIREASLNIETYSLRTGIDIESVPIHDAGDLHVVDDFGVTVERLSKVTGEIFQSGKVPVCIGGEHSITLGPARSLDRSVGVVSFDAHGDLRNEYGGGKFSHATVLRRITEIVGPSNVLICGARAFCKEEIDFIAQNRIQYLTPWEIHGPAMGKAIDKVRNFVQGFKSSYVTIDMDALDPAYAPGVSNPEFDGISPDELLSLLSAAASQRVIGFDLVEVCPNYDSGATAVAAARLIFETIAFIEGPQRG